jgi:transcription elongation factor GreA-like protein
MNEFLAPGDFVRHPDETEWGVGQVQSVIDGKITVNFEHRGKVVIVGSHVELRMDFTQK